MQSGGIRCCTIYSRRTGDAGRGSGRREYFDMERGAGGGAGERALEQVFKQSVSGDARLNRSSGGANPASGDARSNRTMLPCYL